MEIRLRIEGMHCSGCAKAVQRLLEAAPSVTAVSVDLEGGRASVETSAEVDPSYFVAAIEDAGYEARVEN